MPGPFTHIYTARRVADFLGENEFIRHRDGEPDPLQTLDPALIARLGGAHGCADAMNAWPKYTALGAIGPDLFFFLQDYRNALIPCDELMLAMAELYLIDDSKRNDWEPFLVILDQVSHPWATIIRFLIKLQKIWADFKKVWDETVGKVVDAVGQVIDDMTGGMLSALGDAINELATALIALIAEELLTSADILSWFALGMREGVDEKAYLWSDMLHYRRTSHMARALVERALAIADEGDDVVANERSQQFLAYALGWICHVGTDTIAHSYVNEQCGGPFRTHWGRHHVIENHIDAWNYHETRGAAPGLPADAFSAATPAFPALNQSALYFEVQLTPDEPNGDDRPATLPPDGPDLASKNARKEALDTDGEMPDWLAEGIVQALISTYGEVEHPQILGGGDFQKYITNSVDVLTSIVTRLTGGDLDRPISELMDLIAPSSKVNVPHGFPLPWEVKVAYRFMLSFFKRSYMDSFDLKKPRSPTIFTPPADDFDFGPPDFSGPGLSDNPAEDLWDLLKFLFEWASKILKHAAQAAYDIVKSAASAGTFPAREAIYELVTLPAWRVVENVREVLTHIGLVMPQDEERYADGELSKPSEIDTELIRLGHSVDAAFRQALADAIDPLGNLDTDPGLIPSTARNPRSREYPFYPVRDSNGSVVEFRRVWAYPDRTNDGKPNPTELTRTSAGPYPVDSLPNVLFRTDGPGSNQSRRLYETAASPAVTDRLNEDLIGHGSSDQGGPVNPLGDPVVFSAYLVGQIAANPRFQADFNLDADRGYGYLAWDWNRDPNLVSPGPRGLDFNTPCAPPEGEAGWVPPAPMQLHYKHTPDPGCPPQIG